MPKAFSRYAACAFAIASVLLASACGGSEHAASLPKRAPVVVSTAKPLPVAQQVEAAVRHYYDVANEAFRTGDTTELESLSVSTCGCRRLVQLAQTAGAPEGFRGGDFAVTRALVQDI